MEPWLQPFRPVTQKIFIPIRLFRGFGYGFLQHRLLLFSCGTFPGFRANDPKNHRSQRKSQYCQNDFQCQRRFQPFDRYNLRLGLLRSLDTRDRNNLSEVSSGFYFLTASRPQSPVDPGIQTERQILRNGGIFPGSKSGQRTVDNFAQCVKVIAWLGNSTRFQQTRRDETGRADQRVFSCRSDQSGIGKSRSAIDPQNIIRLDVPVNQTVFVQFLQARQQTFQHGHDLFSIQPTIPVQLFCKSVRLIFPVSAIQIIGGIHGVADQLLRDLHVPDLQQVRVVAIFVIPQPFQFPSGKLFLQDLQRNFVADSSFRKPYFAIAAFTAFLQQRAGTKLIACFIHHIWRTPCAVRGRLHSFSAGFHASWQSSVSSPDRPD